MITAIKQYLDNRAATDELFAAKYATPKKSIDECCKYLQQQLGEICLTIREILVE